MSYSAYLIAGESSGDFIASSLMKQLQSLESEIYFYGIGGDMMIKQGLNTLFHMNHINMMGFFEILPHIIRIKKLINETIEDIILKKPNILITIDSPGFTYRVAKVIKKLNLGIKLIHIVAPSVWAYKPKRTIKYAKVYDHLLALLPFEPKYFESVGLRCSYIGHPVLEQEFYNSEKLLLRTNMNIDNDVKIIVTTVGSRLSEIKNHLPVFCKALNKILNHEKKIDVIFVLPNNTYENNIKEYLINNAKFSFRIEYDRLKSFAVADCAIGKSGTNTLEISASHTPLVIAYKVNIISYFLIKLMIKVKFISLINIIANQEIIPELIQFQCTSDAIAAKVIPLLNDKNIIHSQVYDAIEILKTIGLNSEITPSYKAAKIVLNYLNNSKE